MRSAVSLCASAFLVLLVVGAAVQTAGGPACPIKDFSKVPWDSAKTACANPASPTFCDTGPCAMSTALAAGFEAAGVRINGKPFSLVAATDPAAHASIVDACQISVGLEVMKSGVISETAAAKLAECGEQASAAACQQQAVKNEIDAVLQRTKTMRDERMQQQQQQTVAAQQQSARSGATIGKPAGWLGGGVLGLVMLGAALLLP